ncbi:hypothetical protein BJ085DRAFT_28983 [Dimargaris cristalligena]|uniref:MPN domain-containing protein n=1 Tax=Dimargaris cristalligena TaxID=215637 RepID=A0A4P9ZYU5_9FUNG|nr:hypothetical protein BJ085DRAFT_28983 [Dimargaris cristalligena]|eukprot:RKP38142.1 hypothetical protein BJ085DRAFT_28983 [Dimargaris cristalligena]
MASDTALALPSDPATADALTGGVSADTPGSSNISAPGPKSGAPRGRKRGTPGRKKRERASSPPTANLTAQEEEAMSSALIAQLLQQDQGGYYDSDYGGGRQSTTTSANYYAEYDHTGQFSSRSAARSGGRGDDSDGNFSDEDDDYNPMGSRPQGGGRRGGGGGGTRGRPRRSLGTDTADCRPPKSSASAKDRAPRGRKETAPPVTDDETSPLVSSALSDRPSDPSVAKSTSGTSGRARATKRARVDADHAPSLDVNGYRTGGYLDDERQRFIEALELFGRDWKKVVAHIGTRDEKSIRSHAQKHFIKLYRDNLPLPLKVQESGTGYTLSGQPLDPNSASARVYLGKKTQSPRTAPSSLPSTATSSAPSPKPVHVAPSANPFTLEATESTDLPDKLDNGAKPVEVPAEPTEPVVEPIPSAEAPPTGITVATTPITVTPTTTTASIAPVAESTSEPSVPFNAAALNESAFTRAPGMGKLRGPKQVITKTPASPIPRPPKPEVAKAAPPPLPRAPSPTPPPSSQPKASTPETFHPTLPISTARTDYAKSRLRSSRTRSVRLGGGLPDDTDPLSQVKCTAFHGPPASDTPGCQPFRMAVHSNAFVGMDFHSHLMQSEIIGFLAGTWSPTRKELTVQYAFPCRALQTPGQNASVNVEMDPTSEFEVRSQIRERDLQVVGWYHSHPCFLPDPSLVDLENQCSYQALFRNQESNTEPFVGAIVGPYDPQLPGSVSVVNWFYVDTPRRGLDVTTVGVEGAEVTPESLTSSAMITTAPYHHELDLSQVSDPSIIAKRLTFNYQEDNALPTWQADLFLPLLAFCRAEPLRCILHETWKPGSAETRLQKLLTSLTFRMSWVRDLPSASGVNETTPDVATLTTTTLTEMNNTVKAEPVEETVPESTSMQVDESKSLDDNESPDTIALRDSTELALATLAVSPDSTIPQEPAQAAPEATARSEEIPTIDPLSSKTTATTPVPSIRPLNPFTFQLQVSPEQLQTDYFLRGIMESAANW